VTSNGTLPNCSNGTKPASSLGLGNVFGEAELLSCLAGYQLSGYPAGNDSICSWAKTPAKPGSSAARTAASSSSSSSVQQQSIMADFCAAGLGKRTCKPYKQGLSSLASLLNATLAPLLPATVKPAPRTYKSLSLYTCSWWNKATASQKLEIVQRIRNLDGGTLDGNNRIGYGATLKDNAATQMFNGRCTSGYAGAFALYKIYGAAAAFTAANS
jgi:hypothetical protein